MLSDLSDNWRENIGPLGTTYTDSAEWCAGDLDTELTATHQRMEQTFHDFRMANGDIIKKSWHHIYEQLEQDILQEVK